MESERSDCASARLQLRSLEQRGPGKASRDLRASRRLAGRRRNTEFPFGDALEIRYVYYAAAHRNQSPRLQRQLPARYKERVARLQRSRKI